MYIYITVKNWSLGGSTTGSEVPFLPLTLWVQEGCRLRFLSPWSDDQGTGEPGTTSTGWATENPRVYPGACRKAGCGNSATTGPGYGSENSWTPWHVFFNGEMMIDYSNWLSNLGVPIDKPAGCSFRMAFFKGHPDSCGETHWKWRPWMNCWTWGSLLFRANEKHWGHDGTCV